MRQLVYVSAAAKPLDDSDLADILVSARRNNRREGVTGMLLALDIGFLQVLEGPLESVGRVYSRLLKDTRHKGCRILADQPVHRHLFTGWTMGFDKLVADRADTHALYIIAQEAILNAATPERAAELPQLLHRHHSIRGHADIATRPESVAHAA